MRVRVADTDGDAARVAEIYAPYVRDTTISFEEVAPAVSDMAARMRAVLAWTPWLVAEDDDGQVIAFAYASRHRDREGYRRSVDLTAYVDLEWGGRGVGRALYAELLPILRRQRFVNAYAGIGLPNAASVGLHRSIGMSLIGVYEKVGWKLGTWVDVAWYGMRLVGSGGGGSGDQGSSPAEPVPFSQLVTSTG